MIVELGHFTLILAFAVALLQALACPAADQRLLADLLAPRVSSGQKEG